MNGFRFLSNELYYISIIIQITGIYAALIWYFTVFIVYFIFSRKFFQ